MIINKMKGRTVTKRLIFSWIWALVRFVIIFGLAFIILKPTIYKISMAFMTRADLLDSSVNLFSRTPSFNYWSMAWKQMLFPSSLINTFVLSFAVGIIQVVSCAMVGYGLARFKVFGSKILFAFVIIVMLMPYNAIATAQYLRFGFFGFGNFHVNLLDSFFPTFILAFTGTNIKNGLYIYLMREFFRSMPGNLEEAAYIDGCGPIRTFVSVMIPNARGMLSTIFMFSFCWQWADSTYSQRYSSGVPLIGNVFDSIGGGTILETTIVRNAAAFIAIIPLILIFLVFQRSLIKSITLSGMAN